MEPWVVGLVVLVAAGLALIVYGALADRARNRRRAAEMLAPPQRSIPHLDPAARPPRYVTELQARRRPPTGSGREAAGSGATIAEGTEVGVGWASKDFATDSAGHQAVLDAPRVLVCDDAVATVRELLPVLEPSLRRRVPLVLVVPSLAPEVLQTLEVNVIQGKLDLLVVVADDAQRRSIAEISGATPVDRADRQSGFVPDDRYGRLARWVSTRDTSHLVKDGG